MVPIAPNADSEHKHQDQQSHRFSRLMALNLTRPSPAKDISTSSGVAGCAGGSGIKRAHFSIWPSLNLRLSYLR